ncbi:unknow [Vibrio campbellii]|nr:unknow [Vibrio campbellii]
MDANIFDLARALGIIRFDYFNTPCYIRLSMTKMHVVEDATDA